MKLCDAELGGCKLLLDSKKIIKGHFEKQDNYFVQVVKRCQTQQPGEQHVKVLRHVLTFH